MEKRQNGLGRKLEDIADPTGLGDFEIALEKSDAERAQTRAAILATLDAHTELLRRAIPELDPAAALAIRSAELLKADITAALA